MAKKNNKKQNGGRQQFLSDDQFVRQRIRQLEIGECYRGSGIFECGEDAVIVTRKHTGGRISTGFYLVDAWCTGIKKSFFHLRMEDFELEEMIEQFNVDPCTYEEAHNLIYGAIEFAAEAGIEPCKEFALTKYFLEEDTEEIPLIEYEFGKDGKHFLVSHSKLEASKYLPSLRKNLGDNGFDFIIEDGEMDSGNTSDVESEIFTTEDLLRRLDKKAIVELAFHIGFSIDSSLDASEVRKQYLQTILANPDHLLSSLSTEDYSILLEIKDGYYPGKGLSIHSYHHFLSLVALQFARMEFDENDDPIIYLATDFAAKILPLVTEKNLAEYATYRMIELFIEGLANLYGYVSLSEVFSNLKKLLDTKKDKKVRETLDEVYNHSFNLRMMYYYDKEGLLSNGKKDIDENIYFSTRFGWKDQEKLRRAIRNADNSVSGFKEYTVDEIIAAGSSALPIFPNAASEEFKQYLVSIGVDEDDFNDICFEIWFFAMHEGDPVHHRVSYKTYFDTIIKELIREHPNSFSKTEAMEQLDNYVNHLPQWTLKGYSHNEVQKKTARI